MVVEVVVVVLVMLWFLFYLLFLLLRWYANFLASQIHLSIFFLFDLRDLGGDYSGGINSHTLNTFKSQISTSFNWKRNYSFHIKEGVIEEKGNKKVIGVTE